MASRVKARRFHKDLLDFSKTEDFIVTDYAEDCSTLTAMFTGVPNTPHAGGTFEVKLRLLADFPFSSPKVSFVTDVFHPNVGFSGRVCMSLLSEWSPGTSLVEVVEGCRALLGEPNPSSPLNQDAASMLSNNPEVYTDTVKYWTAVFANGPVRPLHLQEKVQQVMAVKQRAEAGVLKTLTKHMWCIESALGRFP